MENPAGWNKIQKLIDIGFRKFRANMARGVIGRSDVTTIYDVLNKAGVLSPENIKPCECGCKCKDRTCEDCHVV